MFHFDPKNYSEDKLEAVLHNEGPMLVLAVAGSGKTYAITHRIAYLIMVRGVNPASIVAVSFTNKAARELKKRVARLVGKEDAARCQLSTFHALGAAILRKHITRLGWKIPFAIFDDTDQKKILKDVCKNYHFVGSEFSPDRLLHMISLTKTKRLRPEQMLPEWNPYRRSFTKIYNEYQSVRKSMNGVDFDDLISLPVDIFEQFPEVLAEYEREWQYLLIDEYQDTNALQFRMIQLLCSHHANIMVVGDDDQAIYAFRGAESEHILNFPNMFENVKVVRFEYNFRSTGYILNAANAVIAQNTKRYPKQLKTKEGNGEVIHVFACPTPEQEAQFVIEQIQQQRAARNLQYKDFAILYRANNQSDIIEQECIKNAVPYRLVGGTKFFDKAEIRDLVFYLRAALNPNDELALRRIVNVPRRGIAAASLEMIDEISKNEDISFFDALKREAEGDRLKASPRMKLVELIEIIETYHRRFAEHEQPLATIFNSMIDDLHFREWISSSSTNDVQTSIRVENIRELVSNLRLFENVEGRDLMGFLHKIVSEPVQGKEDDPNADVVTLMTLHSSKGLEFTSVYLVGCEEDLLPHANALETGRAEDIDEERRLFYVGMTRARRFLTLTRSETRKHGNSVFSPAPSRFLEELPEDGIEQARAESEAARRYQVEIEEKKRKNMAAIRSILYPERDGRDARREAPFESLSVPSEFGPAPTRELSPLLQQASVFVRHEESKPGVQKSVSPFDAFAAIQNNQSQKS